MLSMSDDDGSNLGIEMLMNGKKIRSVDGNSNKSFSINVDHDMPNIDAISVRSEQPQYANNDAMSDVSGASFDQPHIQYANKPSHEDIMNTKRELLYQFARLEKKGVHLPKQFTMASNVDEMNAELERIKRDIEIDASVRFQRRMLMACVSGIEFLNNKFDPFDAHLDGWSETVQDSINDYDDIFEELWDKYHAKIKVAPELRLIFTLGGSAVWFHMSHSMFKTTMPGIDQIFNQNPELKKQFFEATMKTMKAEAPVKEAPAAGGAQPGLGMFGNLGGLFGGGGAHQPAMPNTPRPNMRGPSNVDELLHDINSDNFGRANDDSEVFEIFSNASETSEVMVPKSRSRSRTQRVRKTLDI